MQNEEALKAVAVLGSPPDDVTYFFLVLLAVLMVTHGPWGDNIIAIVTPAPLTSRPRGKKFMPKFVPVVSRP